MTVELLDFLAIKGNYRDVLMFRHSQTIEEKLPNTEVLPRSESLANHYYTPKLSTFTMENNIFYSQCLQWIVQISIPSYRFEEISQSIDYYVKWEIPSLNLAKIKPFKFKEFASLHKTLKRVVHPANMIQFPSKNYIRNLKDKNKDKDSIELRRAQLEYYLLEIFNDPAFICKESLEFIGCDAEVDDVLRNVPDYFYRITDISWE